MGCFTLTRLCEGDGGVFNCLKFNTQLKDQLREYQKLVTPVTKEAAKPDAPIGKPFNLPERVVGGEILWKPVDRLAAKLVSKAPWWAHPPTQQSSEEKTQPKPKKVKNHMVKHASEVASSAVADQKKWVIFGDWAIEVQSLCKKTGEPLLNSVDMWPIMLEQINGMKHELTPAALALVDGEKALRQAVGGAKDTMEELRSSSKVLLDEVRQTKYAVIAEVGAIVAPLKEVRQFFLGKDYESEISRLKEFVELCERLQKLKQSGFLDSVADTMLKLSE